MKKIVYFWIILLFSFSLTIGQTKGRSTILKPASVSQFTEAEKAWGPFWKRFCDAVKSGKLPNEMLARTVRHHGCCRDTNRDGDIRDEFLASLSSNEDTGWKSLRELILTGKPVGQIKKSTNYETGKVDIIRSKGPNSSGGSQPWCPFVFQEGRWMLVDFAYTEV